MAVWIAALVLLAGGAGALESPLPRPLLSLLSTCTRLGPNLYPQDTVNWFEAGKHPQVVLFAHMLFPLQGELEAPPDWHPPLVWPLPPPQPFIAVRDEFFVNARWLDPDGQVLAEHGLTLPARVSTDYVKVEGKLYIPHTFTHTIGTRDLRAQTGQKALPSKAGQYTVKLSLGGRDFGIAFFRMLSGAQVQAQPTVEPTERKALLDAAERIQQALSPPARAK